MYVCLMLLEKDLLTLSMGMGLKLPPFIKVWHIYVCLQVFEIWDINPIYAGLERFCPSDSKNVSYVDIGLV